MKFFSKSIALILAAMLMAASFTACSGKNAPAETTQEPTAAPTQTTTPVPEDPTEDPAASIGKVDNSKLIGAWEGDINFGEQLRELLKADDSGMFSNIEIEDTPCKASVTFAEDGTYTAVFDKEAAKDAVSKLSVKLVDGMKAFVIEMARAAAEGGEELSEEEILKSMELESWDDLDNQMMKVFVESIEKTPAETFGKYALAEDRLYITEDDSDPLAGKSYISVSISGDKLAFQAENEGLNENSVFMLMTELTKLG